MKNLKNLSIQTKLLLLSGVVIVCLFFVTYSSLNGLSSINASQERLFEVEYPTTLNLSKLSVDLARERFALRRMLAATTYTEKVSWHQDMMELKNDVNEKITVILKLSESLPQIQGYLKDFVVVRDSFLLFRDEEIIPAIYQGNKTKEELDLLMGPQSTQNETMRLQIFNASTLSEEHDKTIMNETKKEIHSLTLILIFVGIGACIFAIISTFYLVRITSNPLIELSNISEKVAYGDLSINIPALDRTDEVGTLWLYFSMMVGTLRSVTIDTSLLVSELSGEIGSISEEQNQIDRQMTIDSVKAKMQKLENLIGEYKL